jgi:hypothetical protein
MYSHGTVVFDTDLIAPLYSNMGSDLSHAMKKFTTTEQVSVPQPDDGIKSSGFADIVFDEKTGISFKSKDGTFISLTNEIKKQIELDGK